MTTLGKRNLKEDREVLEYLEHIEKPTTHLNDYKNPVLDPEPDKSVYENLANKGKKKKNEAPEFLCGDLISINAPFNVFIQPRPILDEFNLSAIEDEVKRFIAEQKKPIRTFDRPRVFKCPEVSLDDIADMNVRDMIIKYMYTSETKRTIVNTAEKTNSQYEATSLKDWKYNKSLRAKPDFKKIMAMKECNEEVQPNNWDNAAAKKWAFNKPRFQGQPSKNFWARKQVRGPFYDPLENLIDSSHGEYVAELLRKNQLRLPHTKTDASYMGFKPRNAINIPFEKHTCTPSDFWFTTNQFYGYTAP